MTEDKKDLKFLPRFSYTKLDCEDQCGWKYKLQYIDKNYIFEDTLATELGTLTHAVLEAIARDIMAGREIDYAKYKDMFVNIDKPKEETKADITAPNTSAKDDGSNILGVKILSKKYREEFYDIDPVTGDSYYQKCQQFLAKGIYGFETFMKENPDLEIYDVEHEFLVPYEVEINGVKTTVALYGFIDRILHNKKTGEFIIEDIKTKGKPYDESKLKTPLQFVTYAIGLKTQLGLDDYPTQFYYSLPFCDNLRQQGGTKGFINRGIKKLNKILQEQSDKDFIPKPSPLCYWCAFSPTNPNQPEAGKYKCPYFSLWKKGGTAKSWEVLNQWEGKERHEIVMKRFLLEQQGPGKDLKIEEPDFDF